MPFKVPSSQSKGWGCETDKGGYEASLEIVVREKERERDREAAESITFESLIFHQSLREAKKRTAQSGKWRATDEHHYETESNS